MDYNMSMRTYRVANQCIAAEYDLDVEVSRGDRTTYHLRGLRFHDALGGGAL